jgi:anthranilate synthase component 1
MQEPFDIAADLDTPVSAYLKLASFDPVFLLESVEGGDRLARYSFIGFGGGPLVRLDSDGLRINGQTRPAPADRPSLLGTLRQALAGAPRPLPEVPGIPFRGGLVGVAGFDLVRRLERLQAPAGKPVTGPEAVFVAPRSLIVFDHVTRRVALLHDGSEDDRRALRREIVAALRGPLPAGARGGGAPGRSSRTPGGFPLTSRPGRAGHSSPSPSFTEGGFLDAVGRVQRSILDGDVYQLVLSVRFTGECLTEPFEVYRALRLLNPSPYMYFFDAGGVAVVGSSPEALVRLEGRRALLRPIAGTRPRGGTPEADVALERELLADPKEAAEHVMLVDLARNDLGRVALPGTIDVRPSRTVERYSHVMHLVSGVEGVLAPEHDAFDLFAAAFPAGTVVGAPKIRAMELIDDLEPVRRGLYAGTVGYFGHGGAMDQAIAIRTMEFHDGMFSFQAGAGIVADSVPAQEHAEVLAKAAALEAALRLAEEGL